MSEQETIRDDIAHEITIKEQMLRPCVVFRPRLVKDGDAWTACLGNDIVTGVIGTGSTPENVMLAFDAAWRSNNGADHKY